MRVIGLWERQRDQWNQSMHTLQVCSPHCGCHSNTTNTTSFKCVSYTYLHALPVLSVCTGGGHHCITVVPCTYTWTCTVHQIAALLLLPCRCEAIHPERISMSLVMPDSMAVYEAVVLICLFVIAYMMCMRTCVCNCVWCVYMRVARYVSI